MANIINAPDLPSEDEEDVDYDPTRCMAIHAEYETAMDHLDRSTHLRWI
jgi:hypothetical protein